MTIKCCYCNTEITSVEGSYTTFKDIPEISLNYCKKCYGEIRENLDKNTDDSLTKKRKENDE